MKNLFLFFKGLFIGIGKIIPGVSGSLIAVILGVYEQAIFAINHIKDDFRRSASFLFPLGFGIMVSTVFFSHILLFFLTNYFYFTMFFFCGLIVGEVPHFQKEVIFSHWKDIILFACFFCIPFLFPLFSFSFSFSSSLFCLFVGYFCLGFIDAATMIIPGISGTSLFIMLGVYQSVLLIYSNPFQNMFATSFFVIGLCVGVFVVSYFVELMLKRNRKRFFQCIDGLLWSSIVYLFFSILKGVTISNFVIFACFFFFGFLLTYRIFK